MFQQKTLSFHSHNCIQNPKNYYHFINCQKLKAKKINIRERTINNNQQEFCRDKVPEKKDIESEGKVYKVTFSGKDSQNRTCQVADNKYILDEADRQGIDLPYTCKNGICGACVAKVIKGSVDMSDIDDLTFTLSEEEIEQGMALICMARPRSDVVLETQCDWGYSLGVSEWKGASGKFSADVDPLMGQKWSDMK